MKESTQIKRMEKITRLREELLTWQQIVVNQELRIDRLECTISALVTTLNAQKRLEKFDVAKLNTAMDNIVKIRKAQAQAQAQGNGHDHAPQEAHADSDQG